MRRPLFALVTVLGATLLALLAGEGLARALGERPLSAVVRGGIRDKGPDSAVMAVPDGRLFAGRPGGGEGERLDRWGLRDPDVPVPAPCRLLLLGDSVAWGHGLGADELLSRRLEERLPVAVHTVAFPGWNSAQEAAALDALGPSLHPDLVLVLWVPNDAASAEVEGRDVVYVQRRIHLLPGLSEEAQVALWRRSWLFRRVGDALGGRELLLEEREHRRALARIAATSARLGAPALLAQVPPLVRYPGWREPWGPGRPAAPYTLEAPWRAAVEAATAAGMPRFDLSAAVAGVDPRTLRVAPDDRVHPSAAALVRFADRLAPWIAAELPGRCRGG